MTAAADRHPDAEDGHARDEHSMTIPGGGTRCEICGEPLDGNYVRAQDGAAAHKNCLRARIGTENRPDREGGNP